MRNKAKYILIFLIFFTLIVTFSHKTKALDPVTIAVLTPVAVEGAKVATPYLARGLSSGSHQLAKMMFGLGDLIYFPIGLGKLMLLDFGGGIGNMGHAIMAPVRFIGDGLMLPFAFMGASF